MKETVCVTVWVASVGLTVKVSAVIVQNKHVHLCIALILPIIVALLANTCT